MNPSDLARQVTNGSIENILPFYQQGMVEQKIKKALMEWFINTRETDKENLFYICDERSMSYTSYVRDYLKLSNVESDSHRIMKRFARLKKSWSNDTTVKERDASWDIG